MTQILPVLKVDGKWVANPMVITDRVLDEYGRVVLGEWKIGAEFERGKELVKHGIIDFSLLDEAVEQLVRSCFTQCRTA